MYIYILYIFIHRYTIYNTYVYMVIFQFTECINYNNSKQFSNECYFMMKEYLIERLSSQDELLIQSNCNNSTLCKAYLLQSVSYQNCIEDCLFLFSYYIFMRGYYRVSTSVFISYFRLRKMTSRLRNDDGHIDYSVINSNYFIIIGKRLEYHISNIIYFLPK